MTEELQNKINRNEKLTDEEVKILMNDILAREEKERKENPLPPPELPKPEKSQEQKWLDGDEDLPKEVKIVKGKIVYKTRRELYQEGHISLKEYSAEIRNQRDALLAESDKYMLSDFPISEQEKADVIEYRQRLRDLPKVKGFPDVDIPELGGK